MGANQKVSTESFAATEMNNHILLARLSFPRILSCRDDDDDDDDNDDDEC
jgi:hypothetical protein